jgi:hypothetical protein
VSDYDLADPKLFWQDPAGCPPPPPGQASPEQIDYDEIHRIATYGSITRTLYSEEVDCGSSYSDILSNLIADDNYLYWMSDSAGGLVRLSTSANVGDVPELWHSATSGAAYLAQDETSVFILSRTSNVLRRVSKVTGISLILAGPGTSPKNVQADGKYVYWITGGELKRVSVDGGMVVTIATGVDGYYPEGRRSRFCLPDPCYTEYVFIGQGGDVVRYDNLDGGTDHLYTSTDPTAIVYNLVSYYSGWVSGVSQLFFLESHEVSCPPPPGFCTYQDVLFRTGRGGGTAEALYTTPALELGGIYKIADHLETDGTHVFWNELQKGLLRLPNDASALPQVNLQIVAIEVTQAVQDLDNSVPLIEGRRTFVRVYAEADGESVAGVTAHLYLTDSGGTLVDGPLLPVNPVGQQIQVLKYAGPWERISLNKSFLYELPWDWTTGELRLLAQINPYGYPLEPDYGDNDMALGPLTFEASPRMRVDFYKFWYLWNGQGRTVKGLKQAYSWIRRTYPLASKPGSCHDSSPGFRPCSNSHFDWDLDERVAQTAPECLLLMDEDTRSLCAAKYVNAIMMNYHNTYGYYVPSYGIIADTGEDIFIRGCKTGGDPVASGMDGRLTTPAHEIGHILNRHHPFKGSLDDGGRCGQGPNDGAYDYDYPYFDGRLYYDLTGMYGFDSGDWYFYGGKRIEEPMQVYDGFSAFDFMTYCGNRWISDYNYVAILNHLRLMNAEEEMDLTPQVRISGDFLVIAGHIDADRSVAGILDLRRVGSVVIIPDLIPGDYSIRLVDGGGSTLADYAFTPMADDNSSLLTFGQVVSFTTGAAQVQIVEIASDQVLTSKAISPNPPTIADVALQGAPDPVTGTVTLGWTASDPDGDALVFDVLYSADGGTTFEPLQLNVSGSSAEIDTLPLAGSASAILRVVARDGVNTAEGDTPPFTMANKPPQPQILLPADGIQVNYGQLVNFMGEAEDPLDGSVADAGLSWSNQYGPLGTGALLSVDDLPVGVNTITLHAINSAGLSDSTQITVIVDDDLNWPGPTLDVVPIQVNFQVAPGESLPVSSDVWISNAGSQGGDLVWAAQEDASWLTISAMTGTIPFTLTLQADPAGLSTGDLLTTTLRITATGAATQTAAIPVSLAVGSQWAPPASYRFYLPLVLRGYSVPE